MSYTGFASIYDELMTHAPYDEWAEFTEEIITHANKQINSVLDLGCGTGEVTIRLAEKGYTITGVDKSSEMLSQAMVKSTENQLPISWIKQDITELTGFSNIDLCVSYCDVMNYITSKTDIESVCERVYHSLNDDGLFVFDIHAPHYANEFLIGNTFADVTDELSYIWECEQGDEQTDMYHYLTFFQRVGEHYVRFDEIHHQKVYDIAIYTTILKNVGFSNINIYADFTLENENSLENSERLFILAKK